MARNLRPICKQCRRIGESVCGKQKCAIDRRPFPPGQHGPRNSRQRLTEYGLQLREKQKAKLIYGVLERQFKNYYEQAAQKKGNTGNILLGLLENRLDNVVFRAGFAQTRRQARQLVSHGHFLVNGRRCDIPSRQVRTGDRIELRESSKINSFFVQQKETVGGTTAPGWLTVDQAGWSVVVSGAPQAQDLPQNVAISLIVEFYSR